VYSRVDEFHRYLVPSGEGRGHQAARSVYIVWIEVFWIELLVLCVDQKDIDYITNDTR